MKKPGVAMKKSSVILLTATATVTMVALIACGSKNGGVDVNSKNIAKPGGGGVDQKAVKDQSGAIGLNGPGALNGAGSSSDPFGNSTFNQNLVVDESAVVTSPNVSDTDKKAIEEAKATGQYINLGCTLSQATKDGLLKGLKPLEVKPEKDVNLYTAAKIVICSDPQDEKTRVKFTTTTTLTAGDIYFRSATVMNSPQVLKLIIRTEGLHLAGTSVTKIYAPAKSDTSTGLDLIVSKEITGAFADGQPDDNLKDAKLQLLTAAQLPATPKNPNLGSRGRTGVAPTSDSSADADLANKNTKINTSHTIEEENGNTESF